MEETKFWTKGKIIFLCVVFVIILIIIGAIFIHKSSVKKQYVEFENQLTLNAVNYLDLEGITLKSGEWRKIDIQKIVKKRLVTNKLAKNCTGYVLAQAETKTKAVNYKTYLKCGNAYESTKSDKVLAKGKENKTEEVSKNDTIKPEITLFGDETMKVKLNGKFKDPGAIAKDNVDGDITKKIKKSGKVNTKKEGSYTVKYSVSDSSGNKTSIKRTVIVEASAVEKTKDTTKPEIVFNNPSVVTTICTGSKIDYSKTGLYGYNAYDDVDGNVTDKVTVSGDIGIIDNPGTYELKYSISDKAKNKYTTTRPFIVKSCNTQSTTVTTPAPTPSPTPAPAPAPTPAPSQTPSTTPSVTPTPAPTPTPPTTNTTISVQSVTLNPNRLTLSVGETYKLNAYFSPSNATDKTVTYSSSSGNVSVDSNGNVRANSQGTAIIRATSSNGKFAVCNITVR